MPGQTLSEVRGILAAAGLAPQHRFGQNFLIDLNLMRKLVSAAELTAADTVLEVGPGTGSLTECLLAAGAGVVAVEIDRGLQRVLAERFATEPRFELVAGDVLAGKHTVSPEVRAALARRPPGPGGAYKLVANLPYQVATPLLVDSLLLVPPFERLVCTVQREVGERLVAPVGTDAYGPASVVAQFLADTAVLARVPPAAFWPRPQVDSVMVMLRPRPNAAGGAAAAFAAFVQRGFGQRRKMLRRFLARLEGVAVETACAAAEVSPQARPEDLLPAAWWRLFQAVCSARSG